MNKDNTNVKKCPKCNANIPYLADVCSYCGYEFELESSAISKDQIIENLKSDITAISQLKPASTMHLFLKNSIIVFSITLFFGFFASVIFKSSVGTILVVSSLIVVFFVIIILKDNAFKKKITESVNHKIEDIKLSFSKNQSLLRIYDPNNSQINEFADTFTEKIFTIKQKINKNISNSIILSIILFLALNFYLINIEKPPQKEQYSNIEIYPTNSSVQGIYEPFFCIVNLSYKLYFKSTITNNDTSYYSFTDMYVKKLDDIDTLQIFPKEKMFLTFVNNNKIRIKKSPIFSIVDTLFFDNDNNSDVFRFEYEFKNKQEKENFEKIMKKNPNFMIISN